MNRVWFNGQIIEGPLPLDPGDRGLLLGDGAFETIAVFKGHAVWLDDHLDRLMVAVSVLGLNIERQTIAEGVRQTLRDGHGILRITVTRGPTSRGLGAIETGHSNLMVTLSPWIRGTLYSPVRLITSSIRRNPESITSRHKTLSYADNIAAAREASFRSADDALMLNTHGRVASTTIANVCILHESTLQTPLDSTEGVLKGIALRHSFEYARWPELTRAQSRFDPGLIFAADAVFLTNSIRLIRPVTELDGKPVSQTAANTVRRIFDQLCDEIEVETGTDPRLADAL